MTTSNESKSIESLTSRIVRMVITLGAILSCSFFAVSQFQRAEKEQKEADAARVSEVSVRLPKILELASFRQPGIKAMEPDTVWTGKGAILLHSHYQAPEKVGFIPRRTGHTWELLAKTPSGNYFSVQFAMSEDVDCKLTSIESCLRQSGFTPFTKDGLGLKSHVFKNLKDETLYRELFGEVMPKAELPG